MSSVNMNVVLGILFTCFFSIVSSNQNCSLHSNLANNGRCVSDNKMPCRDMCSGELIEGETNCTNAQHCCFNGTECYLKRLATPPRQTPDQLKQQAMNDLNPNKGVVVTGRNLNLGLPPLPGLTCLKFPANCKTNAKSPAALEPPVNIPYCQRISCEVAPSTVPLDSNVALCLQRPGCFFDFELFLYRLNFGQAILPGVPVCHLVVRNDAFHAKAKEYMRQRGPWNPLNTACFIEEHKVKILENSPGCYMIEVLLHFEHQPKRAGWTGITKKECHLLNGCWRNNLCFYPVDTKQVRVPSDNENKSSVSNVFHTFYGQPMCFPMSSKAEAGKFIDDYHTCLAAGCAVDVRRQSLFSRFYEIVARLPLYLQFEFWSKIVQGEVRPDNWRKQKEKLISDKHNLNANLFRRIVPLNGSLNLPKGVNVKVVPFALNLTSPTRGGGPSPLSGRFQSFATIGNQNRGVTGRSLNSNNQPGVGSTINSPTTGFQFGTPDFSGLSSLGNLGSITGGTGRPFNFNGLLNLQSFLTGNIDLFRLPLFPQPSCYYRPFTWFNQPPLKGSYQDCCDKPLCFIPTSQLRNQRSGVASYLAEWTTWSQCSRSCGSGLQIRKRPCVGPDCLTEPNITRSCNTRPCPHWAQWSAYSNCSKSCGGGRQTRYRLCSGDVGQCAGESSQTRRCRTGVCPTFSSWTKWSECSNRCGKGTQTRRKLCAKAGQYGCKDGQVQQRNCEQYCGLISYRNRTPCNVNTCTYKREPICKEKGPRRYGTCVSASALRAQILCYEGPCLCRYIPSACFSNG